MSLRLLLKDMKRRSLVMKHNAQSMGKVRPTTKSSTSVSGEIVCENEACIGKKVEPDEAWTADAPLVVEKGEIPAATSMAFGGKKACTDDACIGKK